MHDICYDNDSERYEVTVKVNSELLWLARIIQVTGLSVEMIFNRIDAVKC
jgi:hypothetical protein